MTHSDMIDPTQPGPDADRIAEVRGKIAMLEWTNLGGRNTPEINRLVDELSRLLRNEQPKGGDAARLVEDIYGFTCGYCGEHLNTPCAKGNHAAAEDFAQEHGWRITLGHTDPFGGNAHVTCPNCLPAFSEAVTCSINGNRRVAPAPSLAPSPEPQDVRGAWRHYCKEGPDDPVAEEIFEAGWNAALAQSQPVVREGHDEPCYYCGKPCSSLAGNPSEWPIPLCHKDEPGVMKWHHSGCVMDRLVENQSDAQPVGWQRRLRVPDGRLPNAWADCSKSEYDALIDHPSAEVRPLYTAPHRPDASRLIEGREELQQDADRWRAFLNGIPRNSESKRLLIDYADAIRARAADRSAPRSDRGGA